MTGHMDGLGERVTRRSVLGALAGAGVCGVLGSGTAAAAGGDVVWEFETGDDVDSSPTVADGTVFVGSADNNVYALDARDGTERWTYETGSGVRSSPTVVNGTVFVGSGPVESGAVYALDAGVEGLSEGSRVMLGTLGHHGDWRYAEETTDDQTDDNMGQSGDDRDQSNDDTDQSDGSGIGIGTTEMLAVGGGGSLLAILGGLYALQRRSSEEEQTADEPDDRQHQSDSTRGPSSLATTPEPDASEATSSIDDTLDDVTRTLGIVIHRRIGYTVNCT